MGKNMTAHSTSDFVTVLCNQPEASDQIYLYKIWETLLKKS